MAFGESEEAAGPLGRSLMSRLGNELALVYHDVMEAPMPGRWQSLVADLESAMDGHDRSDLDEVSEFPHSAGRGASRG